MTEIDQDLARLEVSPPWDWTEDAAQILLDRLVDATLDPENRLIAARLAGDAVVTDEPLANALLNIMVSAGEPEELRAQAAISLGPALETIDTEGPEGIEDWPMSEETFRRTLKSMRALYEDSGTPKLVRRRVLEASVRAPQAWHREAILASYASDDPEWKLTGVFCMRFERGFEGEILEALESDDEDILYQAVEAAGGWEIEAAWRHIDALLSSRDTDKFLLLAAIEAAPSVNPTEAGMALVDLADSADEDIADAASEAMIMAESFGGELDDEDELDGGDEDDDNDEQDDDDDDDDRRS